MFIVINKVPAGTDPIALRVQVEMLYETDVQAVLPLSIEMARNASGDIFCNRYPDHPLTQELKAIVDRIVGQVVS
jgi:MinD-like ATPase involved in chromosome partitioning or flagellar assembly